MDHFLLIFICLVLGQLCRRFKRFPPTTAQVLNAFVIYVSFPAVIFVQIPKLIAEVKLSFELLIPVSMAWLLFGLSFLIFSTLGKKLKWSSKQTGAIILTAGLANTSFVGFPLLEALIGIEAIQIGIIVDQLGTFLTCSTFGLVVASIYGRNDESRIDAKRIAKNIIFFPPFIVLSLVSLYSLLGFTISSYLHQVAAKISLTLVPLALFAVGFGLNIKGQVLLLKWKQLGLGLAFKLILAPIFFVLLYKGVFSSDSQISLITILEAAMAPMITAAVIAFEFDLDSELANLMVGLGIPLSLLTVPIWHYLLG